MDRQSDLTLSDEIGHDFEGVSAPSRKAQFLELLVFLFLILPSMALSFFAQQGNIGFDLIASATILRDLALVSLIVYFLWRNGEPLSRIGWVAARAGREIALGVALFLPLTVVTNFFEQILRAFGFSGPPQSAKAFLIPKSPGQVALAVLLVVVVAIAEETIFRGYLILRLGAVTGSLSAAALLSAIIFAAGHGYEGTAGVATVGAMGLAFAIVYLWRGSLIAPMVMHFLQDFLVIVALPLLAHKT